MDKKNNWPPQSAITDKKKLEQYAFASTENKKIREESPELFKKKNTNNNTSEDLDKLKTKILNPETILDIKKALKEIEITGNNNSDKEREETTDPNYKKKEEYVDVEIVETNQQKPKSENTNNESKLLTYTKNNEVKDLSIDNDDLNIEEYKSARNNILNNKNLTSEETKKMLKDLNKSYLNQQQQTVNNTNFDLNNKKRARELGIDNDKKIEEKIDILSGEKKGLSVEKMREIGWSQEKIDFQEKREVKRQEFKSLNKEIKKLKENSGFWGKLKSKIGLSEKVDFNGEKLTLKELNEKREDLIRERKESFLENMYLNSEKKDLDKFSSRIEKYSKIEKDIVDGKLEPKEKTAFQEKLSKISPKTWSHLARGTSIAWAATGGAGVVAWGARFITGMVVGKAAALGVDKYFDSKKSQIIGEDELNLKNSKLEKRKDEFDFSKFLKMKTDNFKKLSNIEKKKFWTKLIVSGALGAGAAYGTGDYLNSVNLNGQIDEFIDKNGISFTGHKDNLDVNLSDSKITSPKDLFKDIETHEPSTKSGIDLEPTKFNSDISKTYTNENPLKGLQNQNSELLSTVSEKINHENIKISGLNNNYSVKSGDNLWSIIRDDILKSESGKEFLKLKGLGDFNFDDTKLSDHQVENLVGEILEDIKKDPSKFGFDKNFNPNNLKIGEKINLEKIGEYISNNEQFQEEIKGSLKFGSETSHIETVDGVQQEIYDYPPHNTSATEISLEDYGKDIDHIIPNIPEGAGINPLTGEIYQNQLEELDINQKNFENLKNLKKQIYDLEHPTKGFWFWKTEIEPSHEQIQEAKKIKAEVQKIEVRNNHSIKNIRNNEDIITYNSVISKKDMSAADIWDRELSKSNNEWDFDSQTNNDRYINKVVNLFENNNNFSIFSNKDVLEKFDHEKYGRANYTIEKINGKTTKQFLVFTEKTKEIGNIEYHNNGDIIVNKNGQSIKTNNLNKALDLVKK